MMSQVRKNRRIEFDRYRGVEEALDFGEVPAIVSGQGMDEYIVANLGYKARSLWMESGRRPPYLHNSSVPQPVRDARASRPAHRQVLPGLDPVRSQARRLRNQTIPLRTF